MSDAAGRPTPVAALRLGGIAKTFDGVRVLRGIDLDIRPGRIHALLGGNGSGKSTTLKIVAGVYRADPGGAISVGGDHHPADGFTPAAAHAAGLRFVHQDLGLVDDLTVAENMALVHGFPGRAGSVGWRALRRRTAAELAEAGLALDPRTRVRDLRPGERTLLAIARALQGGAGDRPLVLVLDEPTASLPTHEVEGLLAELRRRRDEGHAVVYVSHRIPEVLAVADDLTVLRDGAVAFTGPVDGLDEAAIVVLMTGAASVSAVTVPPPALETGGVPVLRARGLQFPGVGPVDLDLRPGEVVGIAGLLGSGRSRLLRALSGQLPRTAGTLHLAGAPVHHRSPRAALADGIAYVPEDRAREAAFLDRPLWENISAIAYPRFIRPWGVARRAEKRAAMAAAGRYAVRAAHADVPFASLSGGNQQKAVLARTTWTDPRVLLLDEPSQGVDAMARREIHALVRGHVAAGARAALVVSSDFAELATLCDRVLVVAGGRPRTELSGALLHEDAIARAAHLDLAHERTPR